MNKNNRLSTGLRVVSDEGLCLVARSRVTLVQISHLSFCPAVAEGKADMPGPVI
jgi:hypothetical protein